MEKIIATLTFHEAINYGAVLQCYALQKVIEQIGFESEVLNYSCDNVRNSYFQRPKSLPSLVGWILKSKVRKKRQGAFKSFLAREVKVSESIERDRLPSYCSKYRLVLVGSDQVWNTNITNNDTTYFLDFVPPNKRISYAASIGLEAWKPDSELNFVSLLSEFSVITVREETAADYLAPLLGGRPPVVCDPVFLLSQVEWNHVSVNPDIKGSYILLFAFGRPGEDCISWARHQAKTLNCQLVIFHFGALPIPGVRNVRDAGPAEFLGWVRNARLIISSSFHVCAFSLIFERDFCLFRSSQDKSAITTSLSRIFDLLNCFDLTDRIVDETSLLPPPINFGSSRLTISNIRKASIDVLKGALAK